MSKLRNIVRQVKPVQENNETLYVEKFQSLLTEGKGASTYFEGVIAACHNLSNQREAAFKQKILTDNTVNQFLDAADSGGTPHFATKGKTDEEKLDILYKFLFCTSAIHPRNVGKNIVVVLSNQKLLNSGGSENWCFDIQKNDKLCT